MLYATLRQRKIHVKNPVTVVQNGIGVDQLLLDMDEEWKTMSSIVCVFTLHYTTQEEQTEQVEQEDGSTEEVTKTVTVEKEIAKELLCDFGSPLTVPWECLTETGNLSVSCTGYVDGEKVMTTVLPDSFWNVVKNGPVTGETPLEPTPTLYEQVLLAAGDAREAAKTAHAVAAEVQKARDEGRLNGISPTIAIGSVIEGTQAQVVNSGTPAEAVLDFVLPRGPRGLPGTPGAPGKDAKVTKETVQEALGYLPMDGSLGEAGEFALSDGKGGVTWLRLTNVGEVGA